MASLADVFATVEIPFQVFYFAGEWAILACGRTCEEWRQLVASSRRPLSEVLPRVIYAIGTRVDPTPPSLFQAVTSCSLLSGQLRLGIGNLSREDGSLPSHQSWAAVNSDCRRVSLLRPHLLNSLLEGLLPLPAVDKACYGAALAAWEGTLFLCGGWDDGDEVDSEASEIWDPKSEMWMQIPELPPQVACRTWQAMNKSVRQLSICTNTPTGKLTCPPHLTVVLPHVQRCRYTTDTTWRFDVNSGRWNPLPPMSIARAEAAVAALNGHFYVCGGMQARSRVSPCVERFDPESRRWETLPPMLCARAWASAGVLGESLIVCGGFGEDGEPLASAECFSPVSNTWEMVSEHSLKQADAGFAILSRSSHKS
jgi:hypothetical protein